MLQMSCNDMVKTLCQWQSPKINPSVITYYPFFLNGNAKIFTTFLSFKTMVFASDDNNIFAHSIMVFMVVHYQFADIFQP